mmetsp:Transcript_10859/g.11939  ORF Transcript_10859/g.11939 Transcript_10859/m.11939 type:complete len:300 (-) Transcript_10859:23-922(-)
MDKYRTEDPERSVAAAAVGSLTEVIKRSKAGTIMGLDVDIREAVKVLKSATSETLTVKSACELFLCFVTRTALGKPDFQECKKALITRGTEFTNRTMSARKTVAGKASGFIRDGTTVLTVGYSRVVIETLLSALENNRNQFNVIVTESRPTASGYKTLKRLTDHGIPVTVITDAEVAYTMEQVDVVLVGAESVVESGGIINIMGTYQVAIVAKAFRKPMYVAAESFKFTRLYPLNQKEIPNRFTSPTVPEEVATALKKECNWKHAQLDYTPPAYITLLITDFGVLTPSAVSDELIKLYN